MKKTSSSRKKKVVKKNNGKKNNGKIRVLKGRGPQPYYYIPVSKGGQLLLNSISYVHIIQFIRCWEKSKVLRKWMVQNRHRINSYAVQANTRIFPFFEALEKEKVVSHISQDLLKFTLSQITTRSPKFPKFPKFPKKTKHDGPSQTIMVQGGTVPNLTFSISNVLSYIGSALLLYTGEPRRTVDLKHADDRRSIFGIVFPEIGFRCIAKCTHDIDYIEDYQREAKVYTHFENLTVRDPFVCPFYGGKNGTIIGNLEAGHLNVSFPIQRVRTSVTLHCSATNAKDKFYSIITKWDIEFCTLDECLHIKNTTTHQRNVYLQNVLCVHGLLNEKYGFYHGDLKDDNIMVLKDG